ncbi:centromere protein S-like isoform X1 [Coccinella septempunctata]|uniref:centromere protein S-like isoform X1 n=1 Tax=Coccinella septempunctata TaxID=41139 RepID=UPI001D095DD7|nr:centromere protein S-like isoform X1 [Coccinella septempunctata]
MSFQNAKHNIYSTSRKICREVGDEMGVEYEANALDLIAELAVKKLSLYATDLEAFQKHAKRSTVNADDVKLLVRRNDSLKELVDNKHNDLQGNKPPEANVGVKRKRKTNT